MEVRTDDEIGLGRTRAPAAVNHVAFAAAFLVIEQVAPGREFENLGTNELPGRTLATPGFSQGAMYLRTDTTLYKIAQ